MAQDRVEFGPVDVTFPSPDGWFIYRVGAIVLRDGRVLMARNDRDPYSYSVGGRVHVGESADDALVREVGEELGTAPASWRLAYVHENFFPGHDTGDRFHELALYYVVTMPDGWDLDPARDSHADGLDGTDPCPETYHWVPLDDWDATAAYPAWFGTELPRLGPGVRHLVTRE